MKITTGLLLLCAIIGSCSDIGKHRDNMPIVKYNEYIWLDGTYETLMDNALRCFRLNSIGFPGDSSIRLWSSEAFYPKRSKTHYLNMFELNVKNVRPYAVYFNLEWRAGKDSQCAVISVHKTHLQPKSGWATLKKQMEELQLNRIDTLPNQREIDNTVMEGDLLALQYIHGETTITIDYTTFDRFLSSKSEKARKYYALIRLIKDEFAVNLFADHSGYDRFQFDFK